MNSSTDAVIENCHNRIRIRSQLKYVLKTEKSTIFLFTLNQSVGKSIKKFASQLISTGENVIKTQNIKVSNNLSVQIIEDQNYRVFAINCFQIKECSNNTSEDLMNFILATQIIFKRTPKKKLIVLTAIDTRIDQKIDQYYNEALNFIKLKKLNYLQCIPAKKGGTQIIQNKDQINIKQIFQTLQKNPKQIQNHLDLFIKTTIEKYESLNENQKQIRKSLTNSFMNILNPLKNIINNTLLQKEQLNKSIYDTVIQHVNDLISSLGSKCEQINKFYQNSEKLRQNDNKLAFKSFILRCKQIKQQFKQNKIKNQDPIIVLSKLYKTIINQISKLPIKITKQDINNLNWYISQLIDQSETLYHINSKMSPQFSSILSVIQVPEHAQSQIAKFAVNNKIQQSQSSLYYETYQYILQSSFRGLNMDTQKNVQKIQKSRKQKQQSLPLIKFDAVLSSNQSTTNQIFASIKQFFSNYFKNNQKPSIKKQILLKLFVKSANGLKKQGFPEIAVQIYKKIGFFNKIQECVRDMIIKQGKNIENICKIYEQTGHYFQKCGLFDKVFKYYQLAYQTSQSIQHFNNSLKARLNLIYGLRNQEEAGRIRNILSNKMDQSQYFLTIHTFTSQFKSKIITIDKLVKDIHIQTDIEVSSKELRQFQFIAAAVPQ